MTTMHSSLVVDSHKTQQQQDRQHRFVTPVKINQILRFVSLSLHYY